MLTVHARLRVNGRVIWTSSLGSKKRSVFSIWDFEQTLETEIEKRNGHTKGWTTTSIVVIIKAIHSRARNVHQTIDNYTEIEWEKVLIVIDDESRKWKPDITIKIEISMEEPKQSNPPDILLDATESSTIITTPTDRRTRTHQLLERQRDQGEILINAGDFDRQLVNRWVCHDDRCTNQNNFCFVDEDGLHYDLSHTLQRVWAKALARGDISASLDNPPPTLYRFILRQGPVGLNSRKTRIQEGREDSRKDRDETKSFMGEMMQFTKQSMEMRMQESMMDQMERMSERMSNVRRPPPPPVYSQPSSSSVPEPIIPPPPAAPRPRSKPLTRSSPICNPEDEEFAMEDFLNWKGEPLQSQRAKDRWNGVKEIVQNEMWSLEDLRDMSETSSHIYKRAIQLGIPDGWARAFKTDLRTFKPQWRHGVDKGDVP